MYETPQPSQSMVRIISIFPVRHLTAKANMMCFGGLVLPPMTAVGGERTYVSRYLCSPVPMFPEPMFPGAYVPRYLCSPVPMFPGFCTLIVVISINRLEILPTPWYKNRLGLCLGFRFRVLVTVRLELQTVFRLWLGCGLGLSLYG